MISIFSWACKLFIKLRVTKLVLFSIIASTVFSCGDTVYIVGGERKSVKSAIGKDELEEANQLKKSNDIK